MTAPPARPILFHPSTSSSLSRSDWEDAWDSASDDESPAKISNTWSLASSPRPIASPLHQSSSSNSTLALSYTHLNYPNPSSYSPSFDQHNQHPEAQAHAQAQMQTQNQPQSSGGGNGGGNGTPVHSGWTIVRNRRDQFDSSPDRPLDESTTSAGEHLDAEHDMILGDLDDMPHHKPHSDLNKFIRQDVEDIVSDPLHGILHPSSSSKRSGTPSRSSTEPTPVTEKLMRERSIKSNRRHKFIECLSSPEVSIAELRRLGWAGIPSDLRPLTWQHLLGYVPLPAHLRASTLARKRKEYLSLVEVAFSRERQGLDQQIWHQIEIDVPRTRPGVQLWMYETTQRCLERILYVWAIRHPASGYVQGINDLVTPFFQVFLSAYIDSDPEEFDPGLLSKTALNAVEADSFWCLSRLLDGIQDNYISAQPGIQRSVRRMSELIARIDAPLHAHLESEHVEYMQFSFRWMNCLLMREISVRNTIRMWDTYLSEGADAFSQFHLYVCSAFLVKWSEKLRQMDFQGIIMFLQSPPTQNWGDHEIELLLSEAFVLNSVWQNAQSHFN